MTDEPDKELAAIKATLLAIKDLDQPQQQAVLVYVKDRIWRDIAAKPSPLSRISGTVLTFGGACIGPTTFSAVTQPEMLGGEV